MKIDSRRFYASEDGDEMIRLSAIRAMMKEANPLHVITVAADWSRVTIIWNAHNKYRHIKTYTLTKMRLRKGRHVNGLESQHAKQELPWWCVWGWHTC